MDYNKDIAVLRDLAKKYLEISKKDIQNERRELWRRHNNLEKTPIPILCLSFTLSRIEWTLLKPECVCKDPFFSEFEMYFRKMIFHDSIGDDYVIEPWITMKASVKRPEGGIWGEIRHEKRSDSGGIAFVAEPIIHDIADLSKLKTVHHEIDEKETNARLIRLQEAIGDIIDINVDRRPLYYETYGASDLSTALGEFVGLENMMMDMYDKPELLHELASYMQKAVLTAFDEAEEADDWQTSEMPSTNMGVAYCKGFPDPACRKGKNNSNKMKDLWFFTHGQEFTLVSPQMQEEFLLQYQLPIMSKFGLVSYGCCEDLTRKISMLRKIPNLRRIGVSLVADVAKCAEQIQKDYVFSWRPNPAMVCTKFEPEYIEKVIRDGVEASRECIVDIILKDISTVQGQPERLRQWVEIVRNVTERL